MYWASIPQTFNRPMGGGGGGGGGESASPTSPPAIPPPLCGRCYLAILF